MRLTLVTFYRQNHNIYRIAKYKWEWAKRRKVYHSKAVESMERLGVPMVDAKDYLAEIIENDIVKKTPEEVPVVEKLVTEVLLDETHPLYKPQPCYCLGDNTVLLKGVEQCKSLLNMVQIQEGLPDSVESRIGMHTIPYQDMRVERCIKYSHMLDAMQVKLPRRTDPARYGFVLPRVYGIDANRTFELLISQLLQFCDMVETKPNRSIVLDAFCNAHLTKEGTPFQLQTQADFLVTSESHLLPVVSQDTGKDIPLPNLYPIKSTVSVPKENFYHGCSIFPLPRQIKNCNLHTAIIHFNREEVKNLFEEPVTDSQFMSRTLTQSFTIAASKAQQLYGDDAKELPEPITLQTIHTDNKHFHFAVFQLNTLSLDESASKKNIFWMMPSTINLYNICDYVKGRPTLEGYNPEVFQRLLAFYTT